MTLKNDRVLKAIKREAVDRTPVWLMRQAGRYLPEYRELRSKAGSFMRLCKTPELACEVTLQPLKRFDFDAAILFSDILTIPDAMGLQLDFQETLGPYFAKPVKTLAEIKQLQPPDLAQLEYVYAAIRLIKSELQDRIPLIGFCGSPFTLAAYILEGRGKTGFPTIQKMMVESPNSVKQLLETLALATASHLHAQIAAGVDVVMIFDTWGGLLSTPRYKEFSLFYVKEAIRKLKQASDYNQYKTPIVLFTRGGNRWLSLMAETGCTALGIDWETDLGEARLRVGGKMALQGNLDPAILIKEPEIIRAAVKRVLADYGEGSGHIFNLGHGVTPDVPPEHVTILVETVHEASVKYHLNVKQQQKQCESHQ